MRTALRSFASLVTLTLLATHGEAQSLSLPGGRTPGLGPVQVGKRVPAQTTLLRVSIDSQGSQADGSSDAVALSADGRFVAFSSVANNLAPGGPSGVRDVFVRDLLSGATVLASHTSSGAPGSGASGTVVALSADGRFAAFESWASDLVPGDTNGTLDVFVFDRVLDTLTRVSVASDGGQASGPSSSPSISADGRFVAFSSWASNLVPNDVEQQQDVFVHDLVTGVTERISQAPDGTGGSLGSHSPAISASGRFVAFATRANELVDEPLGWYHYIFVGDRETGEIWHASKNDAGEHAMGECDTRPAISADGQLVAFASYAYNLDPTDTNYLHDVYVHDHVAGTTKRVSLAVDGLATDGGSIEPVLSADGRFVAFTSGAANLVSGDTNGVSDVFVYDMTTGQTRCLSRTSSGALGQGASNAPVLSPDGTWAAFASEAQNLVGGDTNAARDAFLGPVETAQP